MEWIKIEEDMNLAEMKKLGYFLGRYERWSPHYPGGEDRLVGINYYYSHIPEYGKFEIHVCNYPAPVASCHILNNNIFRLTHYMIVDEPND